MDPEVMKRIVSATSKAADILAQSRGDGRVATARALIVSLRYDLEFCGPEYSVVVQTLRVAEAGFEVFR